MKNFVEFKGLLLLAFLALPLTAGAQVQVGLSVDRGGTASIWLSEIITTPRPNKWRWSNSGIFPTRNHPWFSS